MRENLRELLEQAAAYSGAADEDRAALRISEQETELALLLEKHERLAPNSDPHRGH